MNRSVSRSRKRRRALTAPRALAVVLGLAATGAPAVLTGSGTAEEEAVHTPVDDPVVAGTEDADDLDDPVLHW